jgi:SAM-dependent methyltransferase
MDRKTPYVFASERDSGVERFEALADLYDAATVRHIEKLGIARGWTCLEVGAGSGSIAMWLAERVAPGRVIATDRDVSQLDAHALPAIEIWHHDIATDALPTETFDLVHARLVLMHLPNATETLARMVHALRPGGWLVVEEFVTNAENGEKNDPGETLLRTMLAFRTVMQRAGVDLGFGRRLPSILRAQGLTDVGAEGRTCLWTGGTAGTRLMRANYVGLRDAIVETGLVDSDEFDGDLERLNDPQFSTPSPTMWSVWGRRP